MIGNGPKASPGDGGDGRTTEEMLDSIRRMIDDERRTAETGTGDAAPMADDDDDILELVDEVNEETSKPASELVSEEAVRQSSASFAGLAKAVEEEAESARLVRVREGGETVEDMVRAFLRPMLKEWLDAHLPDIVERLVRQEIERVSRPGPAR